VNECASTFVCARHTERGREKRPLSPMRPYFALTVLVGVMTLSKTGSPFDPTL
jgi:hypothetical protein